MAIKFNLQMEWPYSQELIQEEIQIKEKLKQNKTKTPDDNLEN